MKVAGLCSCLLATAVAVYPESGATPARINAARTTSPAVTRPARVEPPQLTETTVNEWVASWQRLLGLEEWKIEAKIVRASVLQKGTVANIHWSLPKHTATIKVLNPLDSSLPKGEILRDTELSIVHELVHLSMARLPLDGTDTEIEEDAVKRISAALMARQDR